MSRLDEELARAAAQDPDEAAPTEVDQAAGREPGAEGGKRSRAGIALVAFLLAAGGGLSALVLTSFESSAIYSAGVDQVLAEREKLSGRTVRVEGTLVKGSLVKRDQPCEYRFLVERNAVRLEVHYPQCSVPDTFRDLPYTDVMVTAEGRLDGAHFLATNIIAKCPSKYEEKSGSVLSGGKVPEGTLHERPAGAAPSSARILAREPGAR